MRQIYYISHPEVIIDPTVPITSWQLSGTGRGRIQQLLKQPWIGNVAALYSSAERKAMDGAEILADGLSLPMQVRESLGEMDRSSTGYLPREEFEATADQFFANPSASIRGWETAIAAQRRIVTTVEQLVAADTTTGAIAIVAHGGVGALLLCHLSNAPIDRCFDQPQLGSYFTFETQPYRLQHGWRAIDTMG